MTTQRLVSTMEAADILGCSGSTVRRYIDEGRLKAISIGSRWLVSRDDLTAFSDGAGRLSKADQEFRALITSMDGDQDRVAAALELSPSAISHRLSSHKHQTWWRAFKDRRRTARRAARQIRVREQNRGYAAKKRHNAEETPK